jgi:phospholipid/cholesterol/gamma-HCH transport system permease protein
MDKSKKSKIELGAPFGLAGSYLLRTLRYVGGLWSLFARYQQMVIQGLLGKRKLRLRESTRQMVRVGFDATPIVFLVLFFVGMILALQIAYTLKKFGVLNEVATVVSIAIVRELGPLITAIVMTGFAGASIAAELGTMKVSEEILALETSALNPIGFLVVPRVIAVMIMVLCLTILANMVGIAGGLFIGTVVLRIDWHLYVSKTFEYLTIKDLLTGLIKTETFAVIIGIISCYEGLEVTGGAEGVGKATTASVVLSIIFIIVADCILTAIFYYIM